MTINNKLLLLLIFVLLTFHLKRHCTSVFYRFIENIYYSLLYINVGDCNMDEEISS